MKWRVNLLLGYVKDVWCVGLKYWYVSDVEDISLNYINDEGDLVNYIID